jgi:hypothetical protein
VGNLACGQWGGRELSPPSIWGTDSWRRHLASLRPIASSVTEVDLAVEPHPGGPGSESCAWGTITVVLDDLRSLMLTCRMGSCAG